MNININTEIGTEGENCWRCQFAPSLSFCELFRVNLKRKPLPDTAVPFLRCKECLQAEAKCKNGVSADMVTPIAKIHNASGKMEDK